MNSKSAQMYKRGAKSIPGSVSRYSVFFPPYPMYVAKAQGCRVTDVDGDERIDFINNMTAIIAGHCHPKVVEAVQQQASTFMGIAMPTEAEIRLAETLCERLPGVERIRFANSGTEGVLFAIRAARAYTGRQKIARVEGAYHGSIDSMETSQLRSNPDTWGPADRPNTTLNNDGVSRSVLNDVVTIPFNDVDATRTILNEHANELAGIIVDPFTGRLAYATASDEYLKMLRDFTTKTGSLLIYDEVMSFRVGYSGAQGRAGITPDISAFGKILGGGLPIGAVGGLAKVMEVFDQDSELFKVLHSGTYSANPMTMVAGHAQLSVMTPDAFDHIENLGKRLRKGLREILNAMNIPGFVRGVASLTFMRLGHDGPFENYRDMIELPHDEKLTMDLHYYLLNHGVHSAESCAWILSNAMTDAEIDFALDQVADGLKSLGAPARATA